MPSAGHETGSNETSALIDNGPHHQHPKHWWSTLPFHVSRIKVAKLVPLLGLLTVFFNEAEFHIKGPAQLRATESMACLEYYASLNDPIARLGTRIPELMCKEKAIQERVAALHGTYYVIRMVTAIIGNLLLLSWFKAGRRRPVLVLHKINLVASNMLLFIAYFGYPRTPIWFITLTGATSIFGGNFDLGTSTLFAAYADIIPDPIYRSNLIFITTSLQYAAQALSLPLTGRLMNLDGTGSTPEVSFYVATACSVAVLLINVLLFPETFNTEWSSDTNGVHEDTLRNPQQDPHSVNGQINNNTSKAAKAPIKLDNPWTVLRQDFGLRRVILLLLATLCGIASSRLIDWYGLMQYPSIKFKWTVSKTTDLITLQAVLSFINFIIILPLINKVCQEKFHVSGRNMNVGITVISSFIVFASAVGFGLPDTTPTLFVAMTALYTLGSGVCSALQAYTVSVASSPRASGAALTVISLAATAGKVLASAIWPTALAIGLEHPSGKLDGLPFFVVAVLYIVVAVSICLADYTDRTKRVEAE